MATKTITKNATAAKTNINTAQQNGSQTPDEHLEKANKAMTKAWTLIARRKDKCD